MAKRAILSNRVVNFKCELDCGGQCCTGLSFALPAEIKYLYDKVPLVLTMEAMDFDSVIKYRHKVIDNQINERLLLRAELALKF